LHYAVGTILTSPTGSRPTARPRDARDLAAVRAEYRAITSSALRNARTILTLTSDIAIVGAGITGLSIAFHLAERDAGSIVVYERDGIGAGASGVQPGGVRQQWSTRPNCLMARDSLAFYLQLDERLSPRVDPGFRPCGYVFVAHESKTFERLQEDVATQNGAGVPSRVATPAELGELVPELEVAGVAGVSVCAEDGFFDRPQSVVEAFAEAAGRLGVVVAQGDVRSIEPVGSRWRLRFADRAQGEAACVIVAAAVETPWLLQPLGADIPIVAESRWLFFSDSVVERLLDPFVVAVDRRFAAKQLGDGRVLVSDLSSTEADDRVAETMRRHVRRVAVELFPRFEYVALALLVHGVYDVTPDRQAIVGPVPGHDGLYVAAGFSGHGFMMAPEIGRGVAAMVMGEPPGETLVHLRPDRFETGTLAYESAVV
jgi:sarcosine oxidase subunit beta